MEDKAYSVNFAAPSSLPDLGGNAQAAAANRQTASPYDALRVYNTLLQQAEPQFNVNFQHVNRTRNLALILQYDGSKFAGYQRQSNAVTVQGLLEQALASVCKEDVTLYGCSRTDAGVHARAFVANFYTNCLIPVAALPIACQSYLPPTITILAAYEMPHNFNARFSNLGKTYVYNLLESRILPAQLQQFAACEHRHLDADLLQAAIPLIVGKRDFRAFCAANSEVSNFVRTIVDISVEVSPLPWPAAGRQLKFYVSGDGFLYNMVRIIVGTLLAVGTKKLTLPELESILVSGERKSAGKTMPAKGLCLERVYYRDAKLSGFQ